MTNTAIVDSYTMPVGSPLEIALDDDFFFPHLPLTEANDTLLIMAAC